jgi:hypothetical protein
MRVGILLGFIAFFIGAYNYVEHASDIHPSAALIGLALFGAIGGLIGKVVEMWIEVE